MKRFSVCLTILILTLTWSCAKDKDQASVLPDSERTEIEMLPFTPIQLDDLSNFKPTTKNWTIVDDVTADRIKKQSFSSIEGTGVLLNLPNEEAKAHLFTNFNHGDIEIEFDVMMPVQSNSGIYFQGRYEVQLFDSWGVEIPKHSDIGGIYQRWNDNAAKGKEGFEGHAPKINAAKASGLWQHFKILFRAPKFDDGGNKIENAKFEEIILNGRLLHKNVEVKGPTRSATFNDEAPLGPLMIQGDHGAVAFKNFKYKLYEDKTIQIKNAVSRIYTNPNSTSTIKKIDSFVKTSEVKTNIISPMKHVDRNERNIITYSGTLNIPASGDYLFEMNVNGGALFIINNDTIIDFNKAIKAQNVIFKKATLTEGDANFEILYNRPSPWNRNFDLFIEGPKMQKYSIKSAGQDPNNKSRHKAIEPITLTTTNKTITQRSFVMHKNEKRTHCISVGLPEQVNYSLDLAKGSLLQFWGGNFLNTTQMWHSRGENQIGEPIGFTVSSHGDVGFAVLENKDMDWPNQSETDLKIQGYTFNAQEIPEFSFKLNDAQIKFTLTAAETEPRAIKRFININTEESIWHKIAEGQNIKNIDGHTYIINNESYYIKFPDNNNLKPIIRRINGKDELLIEAPKGYHKINYTIIW